VDDSSDALPPTTTPEASSYNPFRDGAGHGHAKETPRPHQSSSLSAAVSRATAEKQAAAKASAAVYISRTSGRGLPHSVKDEDEHLGQELNPLPSEAYEAIKRIFQDFHPQNYSSYSNNTIAQRDLATESKGPSEVDEENVAWYVLEQRIIHNVRYAVTNLSDSARERQISKLLQEAQKLEMAPDIDSNNVPNSDYVDLAIKAAAYAPNLSVWFIPML